MSENMLGKIIQVMGPVVDVDFESYLPAINEALEINFDIDGQSHKLVLEVAAHIGDNRIRAIAMDMTEGLTRGERVIAKGNPISVPVGEQVLGRIFNVIGDVIDGGEDLKDPEKWSIHRSAPSFENQSTKTEMFETGIKVVDLLAPYSKGVKLVYLVVQVLVKPLLLWSLSIMLPLSIAVIQCLLVLVRERVKGMICITK